jgi:nickel-dependent lactate racemase
LPQAIAAPLEAPLLAEFLRGAKSPLIVVNDATRSTPTGAILQAMWPVLSATPNWRVIVATGLHRAPTAAEVRVIFGTLEEHVGPRLLVHDGYDEAALTTVESDNLVRMNRAVIEADRLLVINSVEPHFFAGYTGGRKSILPGLAGEKTIERSHAGAVSAAAAPLSVDDNPVRQFIHAHTQFVDPRRIWAMQVVLDREERIAAAFAGDVDVTFARACAAANEFYVVALDRTYDIVLSAVHPPLDLNLYQTMKGWELSQAGVRDGGVVIVTSPCPQGVGAAFYTRLIDTYPDPATWLRLESGPYRLGVHKLVRTARALARFRLFAVTDMPEAEVARYGYEGFTSLDRAVADAVEHVGPAPHVLVVEDSALTTVTGPRG